MISYRLTLVPITPIHIGTGEEIEPLEYTIAEHMLHRHDLGKLIESLSPRHYGELWALIDKNDLPALRAFVQKVATEESCLYHGPVSAEFESLVARGLRVGQASLRVALAARTALDFKPYIPGSSLKGALRTGYLYALAQARGGLPKDSRRVEPELLGYRSRSGRGFVAQEDPFRVLKISDSQPSNEPNRFCRVAHFNLGGSGQFAQIGLCETTPSLATGDDVRFDFDAAILDEKAIRRHFGKRWFDLAEVAQACERFYGEVFRQELNYWKEHGQTEIHRCLLESFEKASKMANSLPGQTTYLRLGWGTGRQGMTIDWTKPAPKTRRVAEDKWPMGWALLAIERAEKAG